MPDDDATTTHAREPLARCWAVFDRADHWQLQAERVGMGFAAFVVVGVFLMLMADVFSRP